MNIKIASELSDTELVAEVARLAASERRTTVELVAHLAELDARRLHLRAGYPSLFVYCTDVLRLSGGGAYNRIEAARTARRFPMALHLLSEGALNLATLRLLGPCLTDENQERLFAAASGKSKREVQMLLAAMFPKPDVPSSVRKLPVVRVAVHPQAVGTMAALTMEPEPSSPTEGTGAAPGGAPGAGITLLAQVEGAPRGPDRSPIGASLAHVRSAAADPPRHPVATPLSADRYQFRFTGSTEMHDRFERAQDLLRHAVPTGDAAEIFDRALVALLADLERKKFAASQRPRAVPALAADARGEGTTRAIPAAVKRAVWVRDSGRCAYVAETGHRCGGTAFVEFHHMIPYAWGGAPTVENIQLRCRAHNGYEAEFDFGTRELVPGRVGQGPGRRDSSARRAPHRGMSG